MQNISRYKLDNGELALWKCPLTLSELLAISPPSDCEKIRSGIFASESRAAQWLAWRVLLRTICTDIHYITYDSNGAPVVDNSSMPSSPIYISVSHSGDYVAVIVATTKCGIDIESKSRNFTRAVKKFAMPCEIERVGLESENSSSGLIWCAKEAVYKWAGEKGVDFLNGIEVQGAALDVKNNVSELKCRFKTETVDVKLIEHSEMFVVYCLR